MAVISPGFELARNADGSTNVRVRAEGLPADLLSAKTAIEAGRFDQAKALLDDRTIDQVRRLLVLDPSRVDVMAMLGLMLARLRRLDEAEHWFRMTVQHGRDAFALDQLAEVCWLQGRFTEATDLRKEAIDLDGTNPDLQVAYGLDLIREGQVQDGIARLRGVLRQRPQDSQLHSKLLFHLHYVADQDSSLLFEEHKQWGRIHAPIGLAETCHRRDLDPHRRIRIGYLSADFRRHSVAYTFEAILTAHDRGVVRTYGYGNVASPDAVTERFRRTFEVYRDVSRLSDPELATLIEQDRIDILVVMAGHTQGHRLTACATKPAPILVDFGGINTSGMGQIDYRLTDEHLDPEASASLYLERLVHLASGFVCYRPPEFAPPVSAPPRERNGYVTFGSFNNRMKINSYGVSLWAAVLKAVPGSRLLLKFAGGDCPRIRDRILEDLERYRIPATMVQIQGWKSPSEHLSMYQQVDVTLDTYPFNGAVTTLEGLWMGVPTISLVGPRYISRAGLTILSSAGLQCLAASSPEQYVAKAAALASEAQALRGLRQTLRQRVMASPLCDAGAHARDLEAAYRQMWRQWCEGQIQNPKPKIKNEESIVDDQLKGRAEV